MQRTWRHQPRRAGRYSLYVMCWNWAVTMLLVSWKRVSSSQVGLKAANCLAMRLCSLSHRVCMMANIGFSLTRESPATGHGLGCVQVNGGFPVVGSSWRFVTLLSVLRRPEVKERVLNIKSIWLDPYTWDASSQWVIWFIWNQNGCNLVKIEIFYVAVQSSYNSILMSIAIHLIYLKCIGIYMALSGINIISPGDICPRQQVAYLRAVMWLICTIPQKSHDKVPGQNSFCSKDFPRHLLSTLLCWLMSYLVGITGNAI
jgi:hypothetical protein